MRKQLVTLVALAALAAVSFSSTAFAGYGSAKSGKDIIQVAKGAGSFNTLLKAVQVAGLTKTLKGEGPFTVFAPTDEAFAKLPAGALDGLLKDPAKLKSVLLYHVVSGKVLAKDVVGLTEATTVNGAKIAIDAKNGVVLNGTSKVVKTDIAASNGVIHVIDTVLLPPTK
jgi:uncharacterized surface protein with fasciclin (FAS1) repeats